MSNLYSTKQKIALAYNIAQNSFGNMNTLASSDPLFTILKRIENKYLKK
ncbi:MAG: hypothetical protein K0R49_1191 [Burkholderiales bacterium]|jgi:hypothetical protein|nr:hypothetical protein [Burkholderiales bacterium]